MREDSQSEACNAGRTPDLNSNVRVALFLLAALSALGGVLRGGGCTNWD